MLGGFSDFFFFVLINKKYIYFLFLFLYTSIEALKVERNRKLKNCYLGQWSTKWLLRKPIGHCGPSPRVPNKNSIHYCSLQTPIIFGLWRLNTYIEKRSSVLLSNTRIFVTFFWEKKYYIAKCCCMPCL